MVLVLSLYKLAGGIPLPRSRSARRPAGVGAGTGSALGIGVATGSSSVFKSVTGVSTALGVSTVSGVTTIASMSGETFVSASEVTVVTAKVIGIDGSFRCAATSANNSESFAN